MENQKEMLRDYSESADVTIENNYLKNNQILEPSNAPPISDQISRHKTVYLNGFGGSGKTTRAI